MNIHFLYLHQKSIDGIVSVVCVGWVNKSVVQGVVVTFWVIVVVVVDDGDEVHEVLHQGELEHHSIKVKQCVKKIMATEYMWLILVQKVFEELHGEKIEKIRVQHFPKMESRWFLRQNMSNLDFIVCQMYYCFDITELLNKIRFIQFFN